MTKSLTIRMRTTVARAAAATSTGVGRRLVARDRGATAVEYGLLVALIAGVIVAVVLVLGQSVSSAFQSVSNGI